MPGCARRLLSGHSAARAGRAQALSALGVRSLALVLTADCNLSCAYCYQDRRGRAALEWRLARRALDRLFRSEERDLHLHLYGGEPLLAFPLFRRVVEHAREATPPGRRLRIDTSTNGILLDDEAIDFLATNEVETQLSFDGVPAAQDRRCPGSFRLLDDRLRRLKRDRRAFFEERLEIAVTVTAANLPALGDSVDYFLDLGVPTILLAPRLTPDPGWRPSGARDLDRQLAHACRASRKHLRRTGRVPVAHFRREQDEPSAPAAPGKMCGVGSGRTLVVDVDGSVYGCVLLAHSYQGLRSPGLQRWIAPLRIGRIGDPALDRRLDAFRARVRRMPLFGRRDRKHSAGARCARCPALAHCAVCPVAIAHVPDNADPHRMPELPCAFTRAIWRHVRHFPARPTDADRISGRAPRPEMVRDLLGFVARAGTRASGRTPA